MKALLLFLICSTSFAMHHESKNKKTQSETIKYDRKITLVNYEIDGVKQWVPGNIAGLEDENIELTLINKAKGPHGFMIPSHNVTVVVPKGGKKKVSLKLKEEGIYPMKCHLHPAHIGGQLIVMDN